MKNKKKIILIIIASLLLAGFLAVIGMNFFVKNKTKDRIISITEAAKLNDVDCVLVLGCQVKENGVPSHMLEDRLKSAIVLYKENPNLKIVMSGDHTGDYNEVKVMKEYAAREGVATEDIFLDHAGYCTYDSIYRMKNTFDAEKIIIISQEYHLYRALYLAEAFGIEAYGVEAVPNVYSGQIFRDIREILARIKDVFTAEFKPLPAVYGDKISLKGNGNNT